MPLTVETGAIVAGANSYVTVAEFKAHVGSIATPAGTDTEIERWGILATRYMDGKYRFRLKGQRVLATQPLEFPRVGVDLGFGRFLASNVVPQEWKDATCELMLRVAAGPLAPDVAPGDRLVKKKIDVIEKEFAPGDFQTSYPVVDQLISRYLKSGNDAVRG